MLTGVYCAICCNGMMSATTTDAQAVRSDAVRTLSQMMMSNRQERNRHSASSAKALPAKILKYDWQNGSWGVATVIMREYNPEGRLSRESEADAAGTVIRETGYTYDADGNIRTEEESLWDESRQMLMPATRTGYEYDTVVKDFCIKKVSETYNGAEWAAGVSEGCRVTRNGQGNVTEVVYSENGKETEKMCVDYGADGKASRITGYEYENGWKLASKYYDITWKETDGQLLMPYEEFGMFVSDGNRMKNCTVEIFDTDSGDANESMSKLTFAYEYTGDGSFTGAIDGMLEDMNISGSFVSNTVLQYGGTFVKITIKAHLGFMVDSLEIGMKTEYDAWHNCLTDMDYMMMDDYYDYEVYKKGEVTYSSTMGLPETYIVKELDYDLYDDEQPVTDADFVNMEKYEFQEYATSGIDGIIPDVEGDNVIYDLSGRRIECPRPNQHYIKNGRKYIEASH